MKVLHLNLPPVPVELARELLAPLGAEVVAVQSTDEAELVEAGRDADAVIGAALGRVCTPAVLDAWTRCRIVSLWSGSTDYLVPDDFTARGIAVAFSADACTDEVADHGMAMMLALGRKLFHWDHAMRERKGDYVPHDPIIEEAGPLPRLRGRTVGCIGLGRAGLALAARTRPFGMRFVAHDPFVPPGTGSDLGVELMSKERVLAESDFLHLYVPMKGDTEHLVGAEELARMKPTAYLVNTSARAAVIDETALLDALAGGRLAGAGLDNLTMVEGTVNPLLARRDVILSPHISHVSDQSYRSMQERVCGDVVRFFGGDWPELLANPAVQDRVTPGPARG